MVSSLGFAHTVLLHRTISNYTAAAVVSNCWLKRAAQSSARVLAGSKRLLLELASAQFGPDPCLPCSSQRFYSFCGLWISPCATSRARSISAHCLARCWDSCGSVQRRSDLERQWESDQNELGRIGLLSPFFCPLASISLSYFEG